MGKKVFTIFDIAEPPPILYKDIKKVSATATYIIPNQRCRSTADSKSVTAPYTQCFSVRVFCSTPKNKRVFVIRLFFGRKCAKNKRFS